MFRAHMDRRQGSVRSFEHINNNISFRFMVGNYRRMLMVEGNVSTSSKEKESLAMGNSDADDGEPDINNYHSIPRQSWDSSQQHGPSDQTPANRHT